jgi:hypothetical protein
MAGRGNAGFPAGSPGVITISDPGLVISFFFATNTLNRLERTRTPLPPLNLPVKTFRLGRIKAAVWENEGDQKFYSVTLARTHIDDADKYHDTDSFGRDDLPLVAKLADQAHTFIFERLAELKIKQSE